MADARRRPPSSSPSEETTPAADARQARPPAFPPLKNVLAVAAGGAVGGSLRYGFIQAFPVAPGMFPIVIFLENLLGAFLLGLFLTLLLDRWRWDLRPFVTTGILGSFTTFSNFTLDTVNLAWGGWYLTAALYSLASPLLGLAAAALGVALGHTFARGAR